MGIRLIKAVTAIPLMLVQFVVIIICSLLIGIWHLITCSIVCYKNNIWSIEIQLLETEDRGWNGYV